MRVLQTLEVTAVYGGLMQSDDDPNFTGTAGCPVGYSGVALYTTTTTSPAGAGGNTTGSATGATSGESTTVTTAPPTTTTTVRYECLPDVPTSSGTTAGNGSGSTGSSSSGTATPEDDDYGPE